MDGAATGIVGGEPVANLAGGLERWWNNPGIAAWSIVFFGCFLLNATLLFAFLVRPGLRTISNRFVMNLTASNLLTCTLLNPLLMMDGPMYAAAGSTTTTTTEDGGRSSMSAASGNICAMSEGATALVTTSSVLSVLLIAIDQYFAVVDPLRYRARVDKLKSGVLIASVWLVSLAFGLMAALNPSPRSLWLSCTTQPTTLLDDSSFGGYLALNVTSFSSSSSSSSTIANTESSVDSVDSMLAFLANETYAMPEEKEETATRSSLLGTIESMRVDGDLGLLDNSTTVTFHGLMGDSVTYGLIYVLVHSLLAYLLPFAGICWIYTSIYSAAHRNSERTRRTGSRPILASPSFYEDPYGMARLPAPPHQPADVFPEEFRRIPKISSLSSIDETSETAHSANQTSRRRSFSSSSDLPARSAPSDETISSSGVVFTVGLQPVKVSAPREQDLADDDEPAETADPQPTRTDYLDEDDRGASSYDDDDDDVAREEDLEEEASRKRRSSRDSTDETGKSSEWLASGDSDDSEDERRRYGYFDTLQVPRAVGKIADRTSSDYLLSLAGCQTTAESRHGDIRGQPTRSEERSSPVAIDLATAAAAERIPHEETANSNNANLQNGKRSRRSSLRRSSRSGVVADHGNHGDARTITRNTLAESNGGLEPSSCLLTPIVTITPAPGKSGNLQRVASIRSTSSYINSLKHRISNGSLFRYREETRAARISALVMVMGLICWSPYVLLNVVKNLPRYADHELPHEYDVLALSFLILAAYASPLLFGYRSRRVKRELRKFFCFRRELSYRNNRSLMAKKVLKRRQSSTLSHLEMDHRYNILNCVYGRSRWPKEKVQFVQVPETALAVETCRSSFSSGASTQISSTSTEEC